MSVSPPELPELTDDEWREAIEELLNEGARRFGPLALTGMMFVTLVGSYGMAPPVTLMPE